MSERSKAQIAALTGLALFVVGCSHAPSTASTPSSTVLMVENGATYVGSPPDIVSVQGAKSAQSFLCIWRPGITASQAITTAGGYSSPPVTTGRIVRGEKVIELDLTELADGRTDPVLQPGDRLELE